MIDWSREHAIEMERRHIRGEKRGSPGKKKSWCDSVVGADGLAFKARELLVRFHEFLVFSAGSP